LEVGQNDCGEGQGPGRTKMAQVAAYRIEVDQTTEGGRGDDGEGEGRFLRSVHCVLHPSSCTVYSINCSWKFGGA